MDAGHWIMISGLLGMLALDVWMYRLVIECNEKRSLLIDELERYKTGEQLLKRMFAGSLYCDDRSATSCETPLIRRNCIGTG